MADGSAADYRFTRGDAGAYDRYLQGMDASMRQKVAMTTAFLLGRGAAADMGMGSGAGSADLAALYPGLQVTGVDIDPDMVALARSRHRAPNLAFIQGDICAPVFPEASLEAIFNSSCLHHVTSFGGYRHDLAEAAIATQARQLRLGGVLIIRDFLNPGEGDILLELPDDDGDESQEPRRCSTARLFERFGGEFRALSAAPGFPWERADHPGLPPGWRGYRVGLRHAAEFILRKDYRRDWELEAKEEYTHLTQTGFERAMEASALRVLASQPIRNPWILRHRFQGRCRLRSLDGAPLPFPATNYLVVGERVAAGQGVAIRERRLEGEPMRFIAVTRHEDAERGQVFDLARRPGEAVDYVPHFTLDGETFVLARLGYPRPILAAADPALDGSRHPQWVSGPLNLLRSDRPLGEAVEDALLDDLGLRAEDILGMAPGCRYWPSPGGVLEQVESVHVQVVPMLARSGLRARSGFSTSGRVGAVEVGQVLRAVQAGGLPDARLELNVYELCLRRGLAVGDWIGEAPALSGRALAGAVPTALAELLGASPARRFRRPRARAGGGFLATRRSAFEEFAGDGRQVAQVALEYVVPEEYGSNTISAALVAIVGGEPCLGVAVDHLPAAQCLTGDSRILVAPSWRLPREHRCLEQAVAFLRERLAAQHGLNVRDCWSLGGKHYPSPGITPETVFPALLEAEAAVPALEPLAWVPLRELVAGRADLRDGHLRIVVLRAAHALGLLPGPA